MKRIHILTAALLATSLAAPAAFAQTGNNGAMSNTGTTAGTYNNNGGNGYGNNGNGYYNNGGNGYGNNGAGYYNNGGNGYANNGYNNTSYGANGGGGNGNAAGAVLTVAPSGVREIQQALNRLGYNAGPIDGVWNQQTASAMLNFQQAHGLAPTGNLNLSSVAGLGLWGSVIGNPIGNGNHPLVGTSGSPPPRGSQNNNGHTIGGGRPMPSQRIVNENGNGS